MTTQAEAVPAELVVDFDVYDPGLAGEVDHFQEVVQNLSAKGPVLYSTAHGGHWLVLAYDLVHEVLRDPYTYSSFPASLLTRDEEHKLLPLELDPPVHAAFRQALQPMFNPNRMKALEPVIRGVVTELIDAFADKGEAEFVSMFAQELPAKVFLALMDLPLSDAPLFSHATEVVMGIGAEATSEEARLAAQDQMVGYLAGVIAERKARPADSQDVTSQLVHGEVTIDGVTRKFTDEELTSLLCLLLMAGLHTVRGSLAWGMVLLAGNAAQRQKLIADPRAIPTAVEEILRAEPPATAARRAAANTTLGGYAISKDDMVLTLACAANNDPAEFEQPLELNIERTPNRHVTFGAGPHRCIGSHLARIELRIAFEELLRRIPDWQIDPDKPQMWHSAMVRGVIQLPITFTPEAS